MKRPKVSVIIPNYNYARYLPTRYKSILEQTYRDFEIIFLDDASTDNSRELFLDQFSRTTAKHIFNTVNSGSPFKQWNSGVNIARGSYVWIAEADDFCDARFLENLITILDTNQDISLAYCQSRPVDIMGSSIGNYTYAEYTRDLDKKRWDSDFIASGIEEVQRFLVLKNTIPNVSAVLFRKEAYLKAGGAETSMRLCGDWLTYCRILRKGQISYCAKLLNYHRQHPKKVTDNSILNLVYFKEFLAVQQYIFQNFHVDEGVKRKAFHRFMGEWSRLSHSDYGKLSFKSHFKLASIALEHYPNQAPVICIALAQRLISFGYL
jgi:glycosyltransferase involved in cell wall biosynthesis